jgi:RNA polymerase sigma-70 factor (ECF subfamily)
MGARRPVEPTDIELMLRVRGDDVAAFRELARRWRGPLTRFLAALIADPSRADDFVQETFLRLWLSRHRYEPTGRFSTYLFQIAKHYWLNQRARLARDRELAPLDGADGACLVQETGPEATLMRRLREERIRRAVAALPVHYREVFTLCHVEGLRYAQISERLGIPLGTVKSRMAEAVRRLRQALWDGDEGE